MKRLKERFRLNGLQYTLLKRNDKLALYGIGGEFTDKILHWEVDMIYIRKDKYVEREAIPTNGQFGRDCSRCFMDENPALDYYDNLTAELYQGVPKVVSGVGEKYEVMLESQYV